MDRHDDRPGFEQASTAHAWFHLPRSEVVFGLAVGLVLSAILVGVMPDARQHMFGGTERRETTVTRVDEGTRSGQSDRKVTEYWVRWVDEGGEVRSAPFKRSGPARHDVGDTWNLWVSASGSTVNDESPLALWLWLGLGLPVASLLIGMLWQWRQRMYVRMTLRDIERRNARLARKAARRAD